MMTCALFTKLQDAVTTIVEDCTTTARVLSPESLGLDSRCADQLYVQNGCIIVHKADDKDLQYFGGFEYIEKEYRLALGQYVVYSSDSSRVQQHTKQLETEH